MPETTAGPGPDLGPLAWEAPGAQDRQPAPCPAGPGLAPPFSWESALTPRHFQMRSGKIIRYVVIKKRDCSGITYLGRCPLSVKIQGSGKTTSHYVQRIRKHFKTDLSQRESTLYVTRTKTKITEDREMPSVIGQAPPGLTCAQPQPQDSL